MPGRDPIKCCKRQGVKEITYDCGTNDEKIIVCDFHANLEPFTLHIKDSKKID